MNHRDKENGIPTGNNEGITTERIGNIIADAICICHAQGTVATGNNKELAPTPKKSLVKPYTNANQVLAYLEAVKMVSC